MQKGHIKRTETPSPRQIREHEFASLSFSQPPTLDLSIGGRERGGGPPTRSGHLDPAPFRRLAALGSGSTQPSTAAWHTLFPSPGKEDPLVRAPPDPSEVACLGRMPDGCFPLERRATRWLLAKTPSAKAPDCVRRDGNDPCPGGDGGSLEDNPDGIPTVW